MRCTDIPHGFGLLFAKWFGWKGEFSHKITKTKTFSVNMMLIFSKLGHFMHFNFGVVDCVLFAVGWNYSTDIACHPVARQIFAIHNDSGITVCLDNRVRSEYSFQVGFNSLAFSGKSCIFNVINLFWWKFYCNFSIHFHFTDHHRHIICPQLWENYFWNFYQKFFSCAAPNT